MTYIDRMEHQIHYVLPYIELVLTCHLNMMNLRHVYCMSQNLYTPDIQVDKLRKNMLIYIY